MKRDARASFTIEGLAALRARLQKPSAQELRDLQREQDIRDMAIAEATIRWPGYELIEITSIGEKPTFLPGLKKVPR